MAVAFDSIGTHGTNSAGCGKPSGSASGKLLVIFWEDDAVKTGTITGWTAIGPTNIGGRSVGILWRIADGTEGASFTIAGIDSGNYAECVCVCYSGTDTTSPINISNTDSSNNAALIASSLSFTRDSCIEVVCANYDLGANSNGAPSGWNIRLNDGAGNFSISDRAQTTHGATGTTDFSNNGNTGGINGAMHIVISPPNVSFIAKSDGHFGTYTGVEPTGSASGDAILAIISAVDIGQVFTATGWTALGTTSGSGFVEAIWVLGIIRGGSAPSYVFDDGTSGGGSIFLRELATHTFRNTATPITSILDGGGLLYSVNGSSTTQTSPAITTTLAEMIISGICIASSSDSGTGASVTAIPAGSTVITTQSEASGEPIGVVRTSLITTGIVSAKSWTISPADAGLGFTLAIAPVPGISGGGGATNPSFGMQPNDMALSSGAYLRY